MNRDRLMPTPWWCERLPPPASTARVAGVPQRDVRRLHAVGRRGGGEREVQARAVGVAVRQVAAGDQRVGDGGEAARTASNSGAKIAHGAAISIVSTTKPLRVKPCSADVSLR